MLDYDGIKQLASDLGCKVTDLIALHPSNDPFYAGVASRREAAVWFAGLWATYGWPVGSHPRRLHYNAISQHPPIIKPNGEPYLNTENDWKFFTSASLAARYLRLLPNGALADHRNDPPMIFADERKTKHPVPEVFGAHAANLGSDIPKCEVSPPYLFAGVLSVAQPYVVEVWVEKSTVNDILVPLAKGLGFAAVKCDELGHAGSLSDGREDVIS